MTNPSVLLSRSDGVLTLTLHNPGARNALTDAMVAAVVAALHSAPDDGATRAVVLAGTQPGFCAGQDRAVLRGLTTANVGAWVERLGGLYDAFRACPLPVVAAIGGAAAGAGLQMALCCDRRIASPAARLLQPEILAGLASIMGPTLIGMHVGLGVTQRLALACETLEAETARDLRLLDEIVPSESLLPKAEAAARKMATADLTAFRLTKAWLREQTEPAFRAAIAMGLTSQAEAVASGAIGRALGAA